MAEAGGKNIELAQKLLENGEKEAHCSSRSKLYFEILEAVILAVVAIFTAWSGYQAVQWGDQQTELYGESIQLNLKAGELRFSDGLDTIYNTATVAAWMDAEVQGHEKVANFFQSRLLPEYKIAFDAWIKTDPINNSQSPPGPRYMSEYRSSKMEEANSLSQEASVKFNEGTQALSTASSYVRYTVFLATVLALVAISQLFKIRSIRNGLVLLSMGLLAYSMMNLYMLPRI
jgi:hypothetical protein